MIDWFKRLFNKRHPTPLARTLRIDPKDTTDMTDQEINEYEEILNIVFNEGKEVLATRKEDGTLDIKKIDHL